MAQSYMVNGQFVCPQLPPSCFGIATQYRLTGADIAESNKDSHGIPSTNVDGTLLKVGDIIDGGIYTVSDKPRKRRAKVGKRRHSKQYDTCVIVPRKKEYKPGSSARIEALQEFYAIYSQDTLLSSDDTISPFNADLADLVSKSAIGKAWEEFDSKEKEISEEEALDSERRERIITRKGK